jgi:hypothetical protein
LPPELDHRDTDSAQLYCPGSCFRPYGDSPAVSAVISVAIGLGQLLQAPGLFFGVLVLFGAAFLILGPLVLNGIELRRKGKEDKVQI